MRKQRRSFFFKVLFIFVLALFVSHFAMFVLNDFLLQGLPVSVTCELKGRGWDLGQSFPFSYFIFKIYEESLET